MKVGELAGLRLASQLVSTRKFSNPADLVHWMGAVQAQDYFASLWAIGLRTRGSSEQSIEEAIADRKIVRTWPMRGTLHYVSPKDVRWMLRYLTPRKVAGAAARFRRLHLDNATFVRSSKIIARELDGGKRRTRDALYRLLEKNKISCAGQRGIHILWRLAQEQLICFGPREGRQPTFVLLDEWIGEGRVLDRDEAFAELALRYFNSHSPATIKDFTWWSGLTTAEARGGLESASSRLASDEIDGNIYWMSRTASPKSGAASKALLLPTFDEFLVGYKDRSFAIAARHGRQLGFGGGIMTPTILYDGQIIGVWKRTFKNERAFIHMHTFAGLKKSQRSAVEEAAERYGKFVGKRVDVRIN